VLYFESRTCQRTSWNSAAIYESKKDRPEDKDALPDGSMTFALRQLFKSPGFTAVALITLALGIGVNTTAFTVLNRLLLQPLPFANSGRLVQIWTTSQQWPQMRHSPGDYFAEKDQSTLFERTGYYYTHSNASVADRGQPPMLLNDEAVDCDFCPTMGVTAALGRSFTAEDQKYEIAAHVQYIMLSNACWRKDFGADPSVVGRTVRLTGFPVTVIGVVSAAFDDPELFGRRIDIWSLEAPDVNRNDHEHAWFFVAGRLKPGVTIEQAQAQLTTIAARLAHDYPKTNAKRGIKVVPFPTDSVGEMGRSMTWMIMGLTLAVLLIAASNLANLQLVRTTGRAKEFAVRVALGAPRSELVRMLLTECLMLALAGGALGLLIAKWANSYLAAYLSVDMPINFRVMGFTLGISAVTGAVFALIPAFFASRSDVNATLKQGGRGVSADRSRHRLRHGLIVAELALTLVLLTGAGYYIRGIQRISQRELGWRPGNVLLGFIELPDEYGKEGPTKSRDFGIRFRSELLALPGVDQAAITGSSPAWGYGDDAFSIEGQAPPPLGQEPLAYDDVVSPGFIKTYGMRILEGRDFTEADRRDGRPVAIINEAMAEKFWPGESPIGKRIRETDPANQEWAEIVGVTNNIVGGSELRPPLTRFAFYRPYDQRANRSPTFALHSASDPRTLEDRVRHILAGIEPDIAISYMATAEETMTSNLSTFILVRRMLTAIAMLGLLLSAVGIYGVIANLASERTHEVGIRMALGAQTGDVCWLFLGNGVRLALLGAVIGLLGSYGLLRILNTTVSIIPGNDPFVVVGVAALLVLVATLACWLPARRATKVNPIVALRAE
jgi:putative ABC transport system permease protein